MTWCTALWVYETCAHLWWVGNTYRVCLFMVDKRGGVGQGLEGMMGEAVGNVSKAMYAKKGRA